MKKNGAKNSVFQKSLNVYLSYPNSLMNKHKSGNELQILNYQRYRQKIIEWQACEMCQTEHHRHYDNPGIHTVKEHGDKHPATRTYCVIGRGCQRRRYKAEERCPTDQAEYTS